LVTRPEAVNDDHAAAALSALAEELETLAAECAAREGSEKANAGPSAKAVNRRLRKKKIMVTIVALQQ
jgi:hypothetical protein